MFSFFHNTSLQKSSCKILTLVLLLAPFQRLSIHHFVSWCMMSSLRLILLICALNKYVVFVYKFNMYTVVILLRNIMIHFPLKLLSRWKQWVRWGRVSVQITHYHWYFADTVLYDWTIHKECTSIWTGI